MFSAGRPQGTQGGLGRMWRGVVTRIGADGIARVEIKKLAKGFEFRCEDYSGSSLFTPSSTNDGDGPHSHTLARVPLAAGTEVIVGFLGPDEPVILGRKV